jgi:voltage-gated potassium channel
MFADVQKLESAALSNPLRWVLWALLGLFAIRPAVQNTVLELLIEVLVIAMFVSLIHQLSPSRLLFVAGCVLIGITAVVRVLDDAKIGLWTASLAHLLPLLLSATVILLLVSFVVRSKVIRHNTVLAAISIYVYMGVFWGFAYLLLYDIDPNSFELDFKSGTAEQQLRYYSFITLTTVGYGDITPKTPQARSFAALEALVGQIYLAAIVARLVGIEITTGMSKKVEQEVQQQLDTKSDPCDDRSRDDRSRDGGR